MICIMRMHFNKSVSARQHILETVCVLHTIRHHGKALNNCPSARTKRAYNTLYHAALEDTVFIVTLYSRGDGS